MKPRPVGLERARHEWREFRKAAVAWGVSVALLLAMSALVGDVDRAAPLLSYLVVLTLALAIWFVAGPRRSASPRPGYLT